MQFQNVEKNLTRESWRWIRGTNDERTTHIIKKQYQIPLSNAITKDTPRGEYSLNYNKKIIRLPSNSKQSKYMFRVGLSDIAVG